MLNTENSEQTPQPDALTEGRDYYLENGYWVFTEYFLLRRGHCCGSGCRHCPYRKKKTRIERSSPGSPPGFGPELQ